MPKCKKCDKFMQSDVENQRYICKCGEVINWVSDEEERKLYALYC